MKRLARAGLGLSLALTLLGLAWWRAMPTANAVTNNTINFQARLQTAAGSIVQDGYYNVEFKLYSAASGGTAEWTEDYTYNSGSGSCSGPLGGNDCRIRVVDGYLTANLGSISSFPSTINWDQQQWLTMNIGGTVTSGSFPAIGDGEMNPRIQLTGVPYAFKAGSAFNIQNTSGTNLLSTSGNQVTLPNAASSSTALTFGGDTTADLYRSGIGALTTDGNLTVGKDLQVNGYLRDIVGGASGANLIPISADAWRNETSFWQLTGAGQASTISIVDPPAGAGPIPTGKVHQFVNASLAGWYDVDQLIAINPDLTYYGKIWAATASGTGKFYAGYIAYDKNLNIIGGNGGTYGYFIASAQSPSATGQWYYGQIHGESTTNNTFPAGTRYIKPLIIVNYNAAGTMDVGGFDISNVPFTQDNGTYKVADSTIFQNVADSTTAFQIQNTSGNSILTVDTQNSQVHIGPSGVPANGVLTIGTNTTAASGGLYFGTDTNLYRGGNNTLQTDDKVVLNGGSQSLQIGTTGCNNLYIGNTTDGIIRCNNQFQFVTTQTQGFNFSGGNLGIGITNPQAALALGSDAGTAVSGIKFGSAGDTNLYRASGGVLKTDNNLTVVGNITATSTIGFSNTGNANQGINLNMMVSNAVNANQVVVIDTANAGQVVKASTGNATGVFGVTTQTQSAGVAQPIVVSGIYQVTADTGAVNVGDYLVTSSLTAGDVMSSTSPAAGTVLGQAMSSKAAGSTGLVWVYINPGYGGGGGGSTSTTVNYNSYGLMESDFINDSPATLGPDRAFSSTVTIGNYIYLLGGTTTVGNCSAGITNTIYRAQVSDPTSWTNTGWTLPAAAGQCGSSVAIIGSYVYIFGGVNSSDAVTNTIYKASVSDLSSWTTSGTIPGASTGSSLAVIGNYIYLYGGSTVNTFGTSTNVIYRASVSDPSTWSDMSSSHTIPGPLAISSLAVIGNYVYLFGGFNGPATTVVYRAAVSDPLTWSNTGVTLPATQGAASLAIIGGYVYRFGGFNNSNYTAVITRAPINNPVNGWVNIGSVLPGASGAEALAIAGNALYIFGGLGSGATATNAIYSAPIYNGSPDVSSNPSWITDSNYSSGGSGTSSQTANNNYELAYNQAISSFTVGSTNSAAPDTVLTASSITSDGNTPVMVQFDAPQVGVAGSTVLDIALYRDSTVVGVQQIVNNNNPGNEDYPVDYQWRDLPSAGSHTYSIRAYKSNANGVTIYANAGGFNTYAPMFIRITLANPQLQGGAGIQNGTTLQTGNFNLQSSSQNNPTGILRGATSQSADIFEVQDAGGANLLSVGPTGNVYVSGNLTVGGTIGFAGSGNSDQGITVNEVVTSAVNAGDVVVIDTANAGRVTDSTTANSTKVFGIATQTHSAGVAQPIVISGIYQVNVGSNTPNIGDYLVTDGNTGEATGTTSPSGGIVGQVTSTATSNKVWALIKPASGAGGGSGGGGMTKLFDTTLASDSSTIDIPNIPSGYDSLKIVGYMRSTRATVTGDNPGIRFNGDSGADYDSHWLDSRDSSASTPYDAHGQTSINGSFTLPAGGNNAGTYGTFTIDVPNYGNASYRKTILTDSGWGDQNSNDRNSGTGGWRSTAAINDITFINLNGGNFAAGSRLTVYGVGGSSGGSSSSLTIPTVHAYASSTTTLTSGVWSTINLGAETFDTNNMHSTSSNPSRITFNTAGTYTLTAQLDYQENGSGAGAGRRMYQLIKNGSTAVAFGVSKPSSNSDTIPTLAVTVQFSAGDYVELQAFQDSGFNITVNSGDPYTSVSAVQEDLQGGGGIQNGTTLQTNANFNIQSASAGSVTATIHGTTSQTADVLDVEDSSNIKLLSVSATGDVGIAGNLSVGGTIGFNNTGNANQAFTINENITGSVTAGDVVVIDTSNAGYVKDSSSANSTQVVGIATKSQTGGSEPIAISGIYQINVTGTVAIGDYLVTSSTTGQAQSSSSPTGGVVGQAMGPAVSGKAWARIAPASGAGGGSSSGGGLTKLYDVTLGSNTASFEVPNIPAGYDSLEGVVYANNDQTSQSQLLIRLNNVVSGYCNEYGYDVGASHSSAENVCAASAGYIGLLPRSVGNGVDAEFTIPNYTATTISGTHVNSQWGAMNNNTTGNIYSGESVSVLSPPQAVNHVSIFSSSGNLLAGSRFILYGVGGSGAVSGGSGGSGTTELNYKQITSPVSITSTSPQTVITADQVYTDGNTPLNIQFYAPSYLEAPGQTMNFGLYDGSTQIGQSWITQSNNSSYMDVPVNIFRELTGSSVPSAGWHTYTVKAWNNNAGTQTVQAGDGVGADWLPAYIRITLANPSLQGGTGSGIQNGTTLQTNANFNIQSASANSVTAIIHGTTSQSADVLDVQNSSNINLMSVDPNGNVFVAGNLNVGGTIGFSNIGNANQGITLNMVVTSGVNAGDVVVIDASNPGQVTTTTLANSTKVFGVATQTQTAGVSQPIITSGIYQVNVDTAAVNIGDYLVTSGIAGLATDSTSPSGGVIGQALSAKATGSNGTVWARINPGNGAGGSGSSANYGLMESDFIDTGANIPEPTGLAGASVATIGNYIYMFGGTLSSGYTNNIYRAPVSNPTSWSVVGTLPHKLSGSSLAIVGSYVYLFGGYDGTSSAYVSTIWRAPTSDPVGSWSSVGNLPGADSYASLAIVNNTIYIYGGYGGSMKNTIYTASTGDPLTWSTSGNVLPQSFDGSQAAIIGSYVYLFGGDNGSTAFSNIYRAKVSSPTVFTSVGNLPSLMRGGMLAIVGNYVYILGGNNQSAYVQSILRAPLSNPVSAWSALTPTIPSPISGGMVYIAGNALYIAGGAQSGSPSVRNSIFSAPIYNGSPDVSSNPSWITDSNAGFGGGSGTSSQTANNNYQLASGTNSNIVQVTASAVASSTTLVSAPATTFDGNTYVNISYYAPAWASLQSTEELAIMLFDGSSPIQQIGYIKVTNGTSSGPIYATTQIEPIAGSHAYSIRAYIPVTTGGDYRFNIYAGTGLSGAEVPMSISITLANPNLQGGAGIQNGTTVQTGNFYIQSSAANNVTAVIQGATSQSADILEVKDASNTNLLAVDASGNLSVKGNIGFSNSGNANQVLTVNEPVTTTVNQYDVVVIDTNNAGQVTTTTLANSSKVFGVATKTSGTAGVSQPIAISGIYQVNVDTAAVNVGDYLVTSGTAGLATDSQYPSGGIIGQAMSAKAAGSNGTVWVRINPGNGTGGSGSGASYGLMESDFTDTGGTLPFANAAGQVVTIGNNLYMFGGNAHPTAIYTAPVSSPTSWTDTGHVLPGSGTAYAQSAIIGSRVYLFGGQVAGSTSNIIYSAPVSDPVTGWITETGTLPTGIMNSSLAIIGNYVYLFGGNDTSGYSQNIYRAPVATPTVWQSTPVGTIPGVLHLSQTAVIGNYVYLFGGYINGGTTTNVIYRAKVSDPATTWVNTGAVLPASTGIGVSQVAIVGDYVYMLGGNVNSSYDKVIYRAPIIDPVHGWVDTKSTLPGNLGFSQASIVGNALYLFGGYNGTSAIANIYSAPIYNGSPNLSSNPSWKVDSNAGSGGSGTSSQTANNNYELGYGQVTTPVPVTATSAATANTIATATPITTDGNTPVMINTHSYTDMPSGGTIWFELYDGSTDLGVLGAVRYSSANEYAGPQDYSLRVTPSAGSHTYSVRAYVSGSGIAVYGNGAYEPAYIRITLANPQLQGGSGINNSTTLQTGNINLQSASANNPTLVVQGATSQSADIMDVKDGSGNIVFNIAPTGSVGIGKSNPQAMLDVNGDIYTGTTAAGGGIYFRRSDGQVSARLTSDASNTELLLASNGGGSHVKIQGSTAGGGYVAINPDGGNVGIGTATVGEALSVNAGAWSSNANGGIQIGAYTSNVTLQRSAAFNLLSNGTGSYRAGIIAGSTEVISLPIDGNQGYVGIGTAAPIDKLQIYNSSAVLTGVVVSNATTGNLATRFGVDSSGRMIIQGGYNSAMNDLIWQNSYGSANVSVSGSLTTNATPDLAETISTASGVEAYDVVSADPNHDESVIKSTKPYDSTAVGVISDGSSSFMVNSYGNDPSHKLINPQPLVLAGRVQVKISDENGSVKPGDYLTSATTPGYAMKATRAGSTIGKALGFFGGDDTSNPATGTTEVNNQTYNTGKVLALINISYYDPITAMLQGDAQDVTNTVVSGNLEVDGNTVFKGDIAVEGHVIGNDDTNGTITVGAGQILSAHTFNTAYSSTPNVVVTPTEDTGNLHWWVTKDNTSFTVHLSGAPTDPLNFDYIIQQGSQ